MTRLLASLNIRGLLSEIVEKRLTYYMVVEHLSVLCEVLGEKVDDKRLLRELLDSHAFLLYYLMNKIAYEKDTRKKQHYLDKIEESIFSIISIAEKRNITYNDIRWELTKINNMLEKT